MKDDVSFDHFSYLVIPTKITLQIVKCNCHLT